MFVPARGMGTWKDPCDFAECDRGVEDGSKVRPTRDSLVWHELHLVNTRTDRSKSLRYTRTGMEAWYGSQEKEIVRKSLLFG